MKTLIVLLLITSCSSTMVKKVGQTSKYAPVNYQDTGAVQYNLAGANWLVEKRKEDAFKQMYEACNGSYEIKREGRKSEFMAVPSEQLSIHYIEFKCTARTPASN
jgi:hypothetical protein